ncbi:MAG: hypothetical protein IH840_11365 [Candidatus Heimdallarchaeota archaeon]|nr:hypothetical protein [Candidatus Heimdallarchaeota archaeon]
MKILSLRYVFWVVVCFVVVVAAFIVRGLFTKGPVSPAGKLLPDPPLELVRRKEKAEEVALIARAEVKTKSGEQKEKLARITEVLDGKQRRKELAEFLNEL